MLSNFNTAYNFLSISLALRIMQNVYPATAQDKSLCSSALIAGMIAGRVVGEAIGDILGRHLVIALVMTLQLVGALISSLSHYSIHLFFAGK
jgi:MFS family permease